jgi:hypothetical protein
MQGFMKSNEYYKMLTADKIENKAKEEERER